MVENPLIYALSGLGKSTVCDGHPERTYDTDIALDSALRDAFPEIEELRARRRAWRSLCQAEPWQARQSREFATWATTRRRFVGEVIKVLRSPEPRLVLTNLLLLPWQYTRYYGVELGGYRTHWAGLQREPDNGQGEAANAYLDGFEPLTRLVPGEFLSDCEDLIALIENTSADAQK